MTKDELKQKAKTAQWSIDNWVYHQKEKAERIWNEHKEEILVLGPVLIVSAEKLIRSASRNQKLKEEKYRKEKCVYDQSSGCYLELRRKLTNQELLELDRRKKNGESKIEILSSMRVLKR